MACQFKSCAAWYDVWLLKWKIVFPGSSLIEANLIWGLPTCLWVIEIPTSGDLSIESLFNLMRQIFIVDLMILIFLSLVLMVQVVHLVTIWCNGRRGLS